jgi:predicted O-methyltransferase YrrM
VRADEQSEDVIESGTKTQGKGSGPLEGAALADWAATWQPEEPPVVAARQRAAEVGVGAVDPATGAALRMLAAAASAKAIVELGTGAGVSSLWLLSGMRPEGILTSVDAEGEHQRLAKTSIAEAGIPAARARLIHGRALEVLPRLSDGAYDLLFCDASRAENADYLNAAARLLRPGGVVAFAGGLGGGRIAESSARDAETVAQREFAKTLRDDERFLAAGIPVGTGLLVAARVA